MLFTFNLKVPSFCTGYQNSAQNLFLSKSSYNFLASLSHLKDWFFWDKKSYLCSCLCWMFAWICMSFVFSKKRQCHGLFRFSRLALQAWNPNFLKLFILCSVKKGNLRSRLKKIRLVLICKMLILEYFHIFGTRAYFYLRVTPQN